MFGTTPPPAAQPAGVTLPAAHGYQAWSWDVALTGSTGSVTTAGLQQLVRIPVPQTIVATNVDVICSTLGATVANCFVGLHTSAGVLIGTSADQSTAFQSTGLKSSALVGGPFTIPGGPDQFVWGAFLCGSAGTMPSLLRVLANSSVAQENANLSAANFRICTNGTGLTALATFTPSANSATVGLGYWVAIK